MVPVLHAVRFRAVLWNGILETRIKILMQKVLPHRITGELTDLIAVVTKKHKSVGSTAGHALAHTSPLQPARIADTQRRLSVVRHAILNKDFEALAEMVELDSNLMHAVMMTSNPPLVYWEPTTVSIIKNVPIWRSENIQVCYTMDAGPNVHLICSKKDVQTVQSKLNDIPGIQDVLIATIGEGTRLVTEKV